MGIRTTTLMVAAAAVCVMLSCGCSRRDAPRDNPAPPVTNTVTAGHITVDVVVEPGAVDFHRDHLLVVRVTAPPHIDISMPDLTDRADSFMVAGVLDTEPQPSDDRRVVRERRALLTPVVAAEYRIAAMAVQWLDKSTAEGKHGWLATRPVMLKSRTPSPYASVQGNPALFRISRSRTIYAWTAMGILVIAALVWVFIILARRIRRSVILRRMSPQERALFELAELLKKNLISRGLVKEFFIELTLIVRSYIERRHAVRAPKQTTEEFLAAAVDNPCFSSDSVALLKSFLESADFVKFAGYQPDQPMIDRSVKLARDYIETDSTKSGTPSAERNPC